ncbi:LysR substrate-binding domain-containing protein, partial [Pseudomonas aeruginosa]|uniref:LysR substrate-binding domain-containing protein n=1 Tax=Pseudomonas aeruginosa TaxID=287 RepID=UPI0039696139
RVSAPDEMRRGVLEEHRLGRQGIKQRRVDIELGHPEAMKHAVRQEVGVSFMFASAVRAEIARGELQVLARPDLSMKVPIYLVHREDKRFSAFQTQLVQFILSRAVPVSVP